MTANGQKPRVLLVEDEVMVAMLIEDILAELGCEVVETAARFEDALASAESGAFDLAVLDVNLNGTRSYPIAELLRSRGVPVIFATGYGTSGLDAAYANAPTLQKPFRASDLEILISRVLSGRD